MTSTNKPVYVGTNGTPKPRATATGPTPTMAVWPAATWSASRSDGYWGYPTRGGLLEDGVNVTMDRYGLLNNIADASKVAPMQPWALSLYRGATA